MSTHRLLVANAQFERFSASPAFGPRAPRLAAMLHDTRADCASIGEMGSAMARRLSEQAGMGAWNEWDRAPGSAPVGRPGEGLNTVWSLQPVFDQPEDRQHSYNLPSAGQWQRTLQMSRLEERSDAAGFVAIATFHCPAAGPGLSRAGANKAKLAYLKAAVAKVGDRRCILAGDLARADDDDDLAWLKAKGWQVHGRSSATPMVALTQGAVHVTGTTPIPHGRAFDHDALLVEFTIPTTQKDPA